LRNEDVTLIKEQQNRNIYKYLISGKTMETQTAKLPTFRGTPLIEIPQNIPQAGFLEGNFGKAFLDEYQGRVKADYKDASALNVLRYDSGVVKGSNPFAVVLANQILRQEGLRTSTQADLEKALRIKALELRGTYEDTGLVLRSEDEPNTYLAKDLMNQVKARNKKQELPVMIPLTGLELRADSNSPHSLAFNLLEGAEIIYAPILNKLGNFNSEDIDEITGLPKQTGQGNRTLYTRDSGLSRLYLYRYLYLNSNYDYLADSGDGGRVVVVSGEATSPEK
jgi:hypothetical protein